MAECVASHRADAGRCRRKLVSVFGSVLFIVIMLAAVWVLVERVKGEAPSVFGYRLLRVATGSMTPEYEVGDVILVKKTPVEALSVGDDITYISRTGETEGLLITHRIIAIGQDESTGEWQIQTQGIAVGTVPDEPVAEDQIYGKAVHICRVLTFVYGIFLTKPGLLLFVLPLVLMMVVEITNLIMMFTEGDAEHVKTDSNTDDDKQT